MFNKRRVKNQYLVYPFDEILYEFIKNWVCEKYLMT